MARKIKDTTRTTQGEMCTPVILVAEDNPLNMRLTCDILKSRGYKTLQVANKRMVVEATRQNRPDLVLLDISAPITSESNLFERIRSDEELNDIPVIAVTNILMTEDEIARMTKDYDELVSKPVSVKNLITKVEEVLAKVKKYAFTK